MLKCNVYVGGINNLSEARYCAGMMVDFLGFNISVIGKERFTEITHWVEGVTLVAECTSGESVDTINQLIDEFSLSYAAVPKYMDGVKAKQIVFSDNGAEDYAFVITDQSSSTLPRQLVRGDMPIEELLTLIEKEIIKGIYLHGGDEIRPGIKDFDELAEILEALEV